MGTKKGAGRSRRPIQGVSWSRSPLVVIHTGVVPIPPIWIAGNYGLIPQPRASSIPITTIVAGPPSQTNSDEAVIEVVVVIGEVIVIVVIAVPVLAMPIVAVPCRAAMPAATAPSTGTGDVSATHSASVDVAATDVASAKTGSAAHVTTTHVTTAHVTTAMASGTRLTHQDRNKQQTARNGSDCGYMLFHDCISLGKQTRQPADFDAGLTPTRGRKFAVGCQPAFKRRCGWPLSTLLAD